MTAPAQRGVIMDAYIYIRFSTPRQENGSSFERQLEECRAYVKRLGWNEVEIISDLGRSAWKGVHLKSGNLGKLAARIMDRELGPNAVIVVEELDRLSRQKARVTQRWIEDVCDAGVAIATAKGERVYTATNLSENLWSVFEILLKGQAAHDYVETLSIRVKASYSDRLKAARDGTAITSIAPAWLEAVGKRPNIRFKPIPERVRIVREIFDLAVAGQSPWAIARIFNQRAEPSFTNIAWERTAIVKILRNPAVEGDRVIGEGKMSKPTGEVLHGYYPAIIPADVVSEARAMLDRRRQGSGRNSGSITNLFGSAIRCGECGGPMRLVGYQSRYLVCYEANRGNGCIHRTSYRYRPFERAALDSVLQFALDERFFRQAKKSNHLTLEIAELEKAIRDNRTTADRAYGMWERTESEAAERRLAETEAQGKALKLKLETLNGKLALAHGAASAEAHLARVHDVREALRHPDESVRFPARLRVSEALHSVIHYVRCETVDGERRIELSLLAGAYAVRIASDGTKLSEVHGNLDTVMAELGEKAQAMVRRMVA